MLTPDEKTVLLIAAQGEPMMPIGRWAAPVAQLVAKGFMRPNPHPGDPTGHFNHRITPAGVDAVEKAEKAEKEDDEDLVALLSGIKLGHRKARAHAEQIAVQMVDLAEASALATGDSKQESLRQWARVILERALEVMK